MRKTGILAALFDLSFSQFVTTKLIKLIYVLNLAVTGLAILVGVVALFMRSVGAGLTGLIVAPIAFVLSAIASRVWSELLIVIFRIAENTGEIAKATRLE